jgi:diguanylate cyclase (GGDEF)-like protein
MTQASHLSRRMARGSAIALLAILAADAAALALVAALGLGDGAAPAGAAITLAATLIAAASTALIVFRPMIRDVADTVAGLEDTQRALAHSALHDHLTGLPNRRYVEEHLRRTLAAAARNGHVVGVLQIDLDGFKQINDRHGHAVGDRVLIGVATQMQAAIRRSDFIGRTGGDEFVVVAVEPRNPRGIGTLAERLIERIEEALGDHMPAGRGGASIGIALSPPLTADPNRLLAQADLALYAVKARGTGGFRFHPDAETYLDVHFPARSPLRLAGA